MNRRRLAHVALGAAILVEGTVGTVTLATRALFVSPATDLATAVDAVVVPSGDNGDRLAAALDLMGKGMAPTLVLVGDPDFAEVARLCHSQEPFEVVCLRPSPDSTRSEARATGRLASDRGWSKLTLVTSSPHVTRARLLFDRCFHGTLTVAGSRPPPNARGREAIIHEWMGFLHARIVARGC